MEKNEREVFVSYVLRNRGRDGTWITGKNEREVFVSYVL